LNESQGWTCTRLLHFSLLLFIQGVQGELVEIKRVAWNGIQKAYQDQENECEPSQSEKKKVRQQYQDSDDYYVVEE